MRIFTTFLLVLATFAAQAVTIRSKGDLRLWQTVFDRTVPLAWDWVEGADAATVTFRRVCATSGEGEVVPMQYGREIAVAVARAPADCRRGCCDVIPPAVSLAVDSLFEVTLVQTGGGVAIGCETAYLAYPQGAAAQPITVRTKTSSDWWRIPVPRAAGFDAAWWGVDGPSGYEVLWRQPSGWYRVERSFADVGVVDEAQLHFVKTGLGIFFR